jgi:hypothetical protein
MIMELRAAEVAGLTCGALGKHNSQLVLGSGEIVCAGISQGQLRLAGQGVPITRLASSFEMR